jgi:DNA-binding response OmpR family regulator
VIAIVSPIDHERSAFAALCASRGWVSAECDSLRAFQRLLQRQRPGVVLTRRRLGDGYSDDVMAALAAAGMAGAVNVVVLIGADTPAAVEARQVALGADCVQRDPVSPDVLAEYLAKYQRAVKPARGPAPPAVERIFSFAGARVDPIDRKIQAGSATGHVTPHEVALVEALVQAQGDVVTYETLYSEILGRKFRGDTSNMRVLLGKLASSARRVGVPLREWVEVIPKLGYRYRRPQPAAAKPIRPTVAPGSRGPTGGAGRRA